MVKRLKVGIVSNEFFDSSLGRMGGFGWAARQIVRCFADTPALGVDIVLLSCEHFHSGGRDPIVHGVPLIARRRNPLTYASRLLRERVELLLCIDYRPSYRRPLYLLPRTPAILWARDPRTPHDAQRVASIRVPGKPDAEPTGVRSVDCTGFRQVKRNSRAFGRPLLYAATGTETALKIPAAYGIGPDEVVLLPNIIPVVSECKKSARPSVAFLGRLDPYKRPWLFVELARRFPGVEFRLLGQMHFQGGNDWQPQDLPPNVIWEGHVDGERKHQILATTWVLVNTSTHEGIAVSWLEALAHATPLLGTVNTDRVVSRFGIHVKDDTGSGERAVAGLAEGLTCLLEDAALRNRLGREGQAWIRATQNKQQFLSAFYELCERAGVNWAPPKEAVSPMAAAIREAHIVNTGASVL